MKLTKFSIFTLFMTILLTSCNVYPDGIAEVVITSHRVTHSESGKYTYHSIKFYDLNDGLCSYSCDESSSPSYIEDAFIRHVIDRVKHIHQDSAMIMKIDFDKFQILEAKRIIARSDIDSIALNYHANKNTEKTTAQLEIEKAESKLRTLKIFRVFMLIVIAIGIFHLTPKLINLIRYMNKKSSIHQELDRRRKSDEREIKTRIINELKSQGYDEKSIKEVYDDLSKHM